MTTLLILATGLAIVLVGILALRLHAFVALILAALAIALLTPQRLVLRSAVMQQAVRDVAVSDDGRWLTTQKRLPDGGPWAVMIDRGSDQELQPVGVIHDDGANDDRFDDSAKPGSVDFVHEFPISESQEPLLSAEIRSADAALLIVRQRDLETGRRVSATPFMSRVTLALGDYCGRLAILIVAASIIGRCLLDSGAADRIVRWSLGLVGEARAPVAFVFSGFLLGIPVFFDTVFLLMIPLGKALRRRTKKNYLLYVLSIVAGATMAHSLVPPTPGPLFVMEAFGVSFPQMLFGGILVGSFTAAVGLSYAVWINRRCELPLRDEADAPQDEEAADVATTADARDIEAERLPSLRFSVTPILLPVLLISAAALLSQAVATDEPWVVADWNFSEWLRSDPAGLATAKVVAVVGEKNLALLIAAAVAVVMYVATRRPSKDQLSSSLQTAVASAGTIILVTAAGGSFGRMMNETSVAELLQNLPGRSPVMLVVAAFLVTTAVRTAQGSATVAMITSAGIFGSLVAGGAAGVHPLYVALAVGCGSKPVSWMNDSGFWVITKMSGMTESEGLRYVTPMTGLAGLSGLAVIVVAVLFRPML